MKQSRKLTLIILAILTVILVAVSIIITLRVQQNEAPVSDKAACKPGTYICRSDDSSICPGLVSPNPVYNAMVGQLCGSDCEFTEACAPHVTEGSSCTANYVDLPSQKIIRSSYVEANLHPNYKAFVGCNKDNQAQNCFCDGNGGDPTRGNGFDSGTVKCFDDQTNDNCGAKATNTSTAQVAPQPQPQPTNTVSFPVSTPVIPTSFTIQPEPPPTIVNQCVSINSTANVAGGKGNTQEFTLVIQSSSSTNPLPQIKLKVVNGQTIVGRDAFKTSSPLVSPEPTDGVTQGNGSWIYKFKWEAAGTDDSPVASGVYQAIALKDGTNQTTDGNCQKEIAVTSSVTVAQQQQPLFSMVENSAPTCDTNGDAVVTYTISVTNLTTSIQTVNFVNDTLDTSIVNMGISPTSVDPNFGTFNAGILTWGGADSDKSFASQQTKQYTYQIRVPLADLPNFTSGVNNKSLVQYNTGSTFSTISFNLKTNLQCTIISNLPITGIMDDLRFLLIGLTLIILGVISYQKKIGYGFGVKLIDDVENRANKFNKFVKTKLPFMPFEEGAEENLKLKIGKSKKKS